MVSDVLGSVACTNESVVSFFKFSKASAASADRENPLAWERGRIFSEKLGIH